MSTYVIGWIVGIFIGVPSMIILHKLLKFLFSSDQSKIELCDRDRENVIDRVKESFITGGPHCGKEMIHHWVVSEVKDMIWPGWADEVTKDTEVVQELTQKCYDYVDNWWAERRDYEHKKHKKAQNVKRLMAVKSHLDKNRKKPPLWARELF